MRDDWDARKAAHATDLANARTDMDHLHREAQQLRAHANQLMATNFDYKKFVQAVTEEDDAIRLQLDAMLETDLRTLQYSNMGVACLKLGASLEKFLTAVQLKTSQQDATPPSDIARFEAEGQRNRAQIIALRNEVDELQIGFRTMERLSADRLEMVEQLRVELEETIARDAQRQEAHNHVEASLHQQIQCHIESIEQLQAEKRQLQQGAGHDKDTYEDVLREEFQVMRKAFELKARQAQDRVEVQEKAHFRQIQDLLRKHKEERALEEIKTKKIVHELELLKEQHHQHTRTPGAS
ncbi:hypothetical protein ACHHYP_14777 [Achlya hypogyna]|uniref:Uncharacterized protein n=1 Tax=Achlya hypogyna TaxID=1202772 RepID=A0A1V9YCD9_ACHHY|nr:hypothetical protein ACHHYP_14777 [Achlya hypogyna]